MADEIRNKEIHGTSVLPDVEPDVADDRAQPGDVLGIERDGERTHLGETAEDEDERREDALDADRNRRQ